MTGRLDVHDLRVWFGGVKAVDGISLTVSPGKVHGVVGPNGSGKTTLVNAVSGVQALTGGRLELDGTDLTGSPAHVVSRAGIARTFQSIKLIPTLTVRENVLLGADGLTPDAAAGRDVFGRAARRRAATAAAQSAGEALERLEIAHLADRAPDELSYGTRRRIEIARALAARPTLLLLDEPLAGMSRGERAEVAGVIRRLGDEGLTLFVVEHDLRTLLGICDHLFVMNFGRLIAEGPPRETAAGPEVQEAYLGGPVALLEVRGLVVRYGQLTAVHGIDVDVQEGEVVVLLGANGAGKSSTLNALSGVVPAAAGTVTFRGTPITNRRPHVVARAGLVQVAEGRRIIAPLTVRENLELGAYPVRSRVRRAELAAQVADLFPELTVLADRPGGLLSGGEQQMLAFGRALMADPVAMMLDEPSMGLAPIVVDRVVDAIREIAARGMSVLMVEQNAAAALDLAHTAYVLEQGEITLSGPADQVRDDPLVLRAFLGVETTPTTPEPA